MKTIKFNPEGKTLFEAYGFENHEEVFDAFIEKQATSIKEIAADPSDDINEVEIAKTILSRYTDEEILMMATKQLIREFEEYAEMSIVLHSVSKKLDT